MEEEDPIAQRWAAFLGDLSKGLLSHEIEAVTLQGIEVVRARRGHFLCKFVVPSRLSDSNGNWHVGAMTTLIDAVSAATINSVSGEGGAISVDFSLSFYGAAKIQEEVEIEAKVVGEKGKISSVMVEVRRKENGDLLALGKQWMSLSLNSRKPSKL